jgi:hypothetical protein
MLKLTPSFRPVPHQEAIAHILDIGCKDRTKALAMDISKLTFITDIGETSGRASRTTPLAACRVWMCLWLIRRNMRRGIGKIGKTISWGSEGGFEAGSGVS